MESWNDYKRIFENISLYEMLDEIFTIRRVQDEVIRLNQEQLQTGIDANDKKIRTISAEEQGNSQVYSLYTIARKAEKNQPFGVVTLKDTGEFYDSFNVRITNNGYQVEANFDKPDGNILDNFDSSYDFLGLNIESIAELAYETILPRLEKILLEKLNVKIS